MWFPSRLLAYKDCTKQFDSFRCSKYFFVLDIKLGCPFYISQLTNNSQ